MLQSLQVEIRLCRGHRPALLGEVEKLSPAAQGELLRLLRDLRQDLANAERTYRPFPGGPRIRM